MYESTLLAWEYEGGALLFVTRAAAIHALRVRLEQAERRRNILSLRLTPEDYLAADSAVCALEAQLHACLDYAAMRA